MQPDPVQPAVARPDHVVGRVVATDRPQHQPGDPDDERQRPESPRHLQVTGRVLAGGPEDPVPDHRDGEREEIPHVREDIDLER